MQTRFKEKLVNWQSLVDNLAPKLGELPHLAADHAALAALLPKARELQSSQEAAVAQLRDVNRQRAEMLRQGIQLGKSLGHGLKQAFGETSQKLLQYGVKPRQPLVRRKRQSAQEKLARSASQAAVAHAAASTQPAAAGHPSDPPE
jgi:hypothetical protein